MADTFRYKKLAEILTERRNALNASKNTLLAGINPKIAEVFIANVYANAADPRLLTDARVSEREIIAIDVANDKMADIKKGISTENWIASLLHGKGTGKKVSPNPGESEVVVTTPPNTSKLQKEDLLTSYRNVLGVDENASPEQIKKAYWDQVRHTHPDNPEFKNASENERNEAYEKTIALNEAFAALYILGNSNNSAPINNYDQQQSQGPNFSLPGPITNKVSGFVKSKVGQALPDSVKSFGTSLTKKFGKEAVAKAGVKIAAKAGITLSTQAAASSVPIIGNVIAFIVTDILPRLKKLFTKLTDSILGIVGSITNTRDKKKQAAYLLLASGGMFVFGGYAMAGAGLMGLGIATGGASGLLTSALGTALLIPRLVFGVVLQATVMFFSSVFWAIIIVVVGTTLIYTIIQMGAYVVPPGGFGTQTEMGVRGQFNRANLDPGIPPPNFPVEGDLPNRTLYMSVDKESDIQQLENNNGVNEVTFTVTVEASRSDLTLREMFCYNTLWGSGETPPESSEPNVQGVYIPQGGSHSFTYTVPIDTNQINDASMMDRCCVVGVADGTNRGACGTTTITIGETSLMCVNPVTDSFSRSQAELDNLNAAIAGMSNSGSFGALLCACGQINICHVDDLPGDWWGFHSNTAECTIQLTSEGLSNVSEATWILGHELGHRLEYCNASTYICFKDYPGLREEGKVCSYTGIASAGDSEDFAESIGRYLSGYKGSYGYCFSGDFCDAYPVHCQALESCVFGQ